MIFRLHLPLASPSIIFSRISLVSSEFSYIRLILSFYSIERNISFRDTKRNNLFSYLSTLRTSSNEMRRWGGEISLSRLRVRDQNNRCQFSVTYPKKDGYKSYEIRRIFPNNRVFFLRWFSLSPILRAISTNSVPLAIRPSFSKKMDVSYDYDRLIIR